MSNFNIDDFLNTCKEIASQKDKSTWKYVSDEYTKVDKLLSRLNEKDPNFYAIKRYEKVVGGLLTFLNTGIKDSFLTEDEFHSYKPIIEAMVEHESYSKDALSYFNKN